MPNWRDNLPDELKGEASLANFETEADLAKGFIEAKKLQGNSIRIPGEDAGEEDRSAFYDKMLEKLPNFMLKPNFENQEQSDEFFRSLGKPKSAESYTIPEIEGVPEGYEFDESRQKALRELAHSLNLTDAQFKGMAKSLMENELKMNAAKSEAAKANKEALKSAWGAAFEDNMKLVAIALTATKAPESLVESIKNGTASPENVQWLYSVGKQLGSEGNELGDEFDNINKNRGMSPAEAREAINEINNNRDHPYWGKSSVPGHDEAVKRMIQLQKWARASA